MVFAEFIGAPDFSKLVESLAAEFPNIESGVQCDSWIWIHGAEGKVQIDDFTSLKLQVKCGRTDNSNLQPLLEFLATSHRLKLVDPPEFEAHEPEPEL